MSDAHITVLVGPTAVGKGTVVAKLRERYPQLWVSVSATTRNPRPGEVDGVNYLFVSRDEFQQLIDSGNMLEWAEVHGSNFYGTPRPPIDEAISQGKSVLLEIDLAGARQVRETLPDALFVFLAPPSWEELVARLKGRGTESEEQMARRLETARIELDAQKEFDEIVINDDLDTTVSTLARIIGLE
ncbi:guanylate kinase [Schaalia sp. ZJ405]|uniref:guanylate kinase n=1 Tax=unclassified Schaalia TaxID=2691889 RepID=UPI0013EE1A5F|nr:MULTISPECIES: guanylate kinase [unclassified Schaalia]QPK82093.1 guanylate kinase [Schaalia sp. ZJ405]